METASGSAGIRGRAVLTVHRRFGRTGGQAEPRELTAADYAAADAIFASLPSADGTNGGTAGAADTGRSAIGWRQPTASGRARSPRTAAA